MNGRGKKAPFYLLLIVAVPFFCSMLFSISKFALSIKEQTENNETIRLEKNQFHWIKAEKEISVNNKLFDVQSYTIQDGIYVLTGYFDGAEDVLMRSGELLHHRSNTRQGFFKALLGFIFYPLSIFSTDDSSWKLVCINDVIDYKDGDLAFTFIEVVQPPPDIHF